MNYRARALFQRVPGPCRMRGLTLVELMISLTLTLLIVLAVTSLFIGMSRSYATQDDDSKLQENVRFLNATLMQQLRQAGFRDVTSTGGFAAGTAIVDGVNGATAGASDILTIRYFGGSRPDGTADGSVTDCLGNAIGLNVQVTETYYVANFTDADGRVAPALHCAVNPTDPTAPTGGTPLFGGVETLQVLYGEDLDGNGSVDRFGPVASVALDRVRALRVGAVLRSDGLGHPAGPLIYNLFGASYAPANAAPSADPGAVFSLAAADGRLRRVVSFTVGVRNRLQ